MAANSNYILTAVNNGLTVYDDVGVEVAAFTTFTSFFQTKQPAGWQGFYFDPRVAYVTAEGQFLLLVAGRDDVAQSSYVFLAVSQTSDPSGSGGSIDTVQIRTANRTSGWIARSP